MKASEAYKIAEEAKAKGKDVRLDKYIEYIDRDITYNAKLGKLKLVVNYLDRPLPDDFILKIQDHFIADEYTIKTDDDPERFRYFTIGWNKDIDE